MSTTDTQDLRVKAQRIREDIASIDKKIHRMQRSRETRVARLEEIENELRTAGSQHSGRRKKHVG